MQPLPNYFGRLFIYKMADVFLIFICLNDGYKTNGGYLGTWHFVSVAVDSRCGCSTAISTPALRNS